MPSKKIGQQTIQFVDPPIIAASATIVGPKEGEGPLADTFDKVLEDNYYGEQSWEKTERKMLLESIQMVLSKAGMSPDQVDFLLAGDLLNQTISANFAASKIGIPFLGLYGACSTIYEGISIGAMLIDGGFADVVIAAASSHYGTAERQFRYPTEQGAQRPMYAQWTVTGAAALLLTKTGSGPRITCATPGKVVDMGVKDPNDMGSAMAPAAVDTLVQHFRDTGRAPSDYSLIATGDLASFGKTLAVNLAQHAGIDLTANYTDCGILIYDVSQDTHAGGSGCGCSAVVTGGHFLQQIIKGRYHKFLGVGTGALLSPLTAQQGESIPSIGHAVVIEA